MLEWTTGYFVTTHYILFRNHEYSSVIHVFRNHEYSADIHVFRNHGDSADIHVFRNHGDSADIHVCACYRTANINMCT